MCWGGFKAFRMQEYYYFHSPCKSLILFLSHWLCSPPLVQHIQMFHVFSHWFSFLLLVIVRFATHGYILLKLMDGSECYWTGHIWSIGKISLCHSLISYGLVLWLKIMRSDSYLCRMRSCVLLTLTRFAKVHWIAVEISLLWSIPWQKGWF